MNGQHGGREQFRIWLNERTKFPLMPAGSFNVFLNN